MDFENNSQINCLIDLKKIKNIKINQRILRSFIAKDIFSNFSNFSNSYFQQPSIPV